MFWQLLQVNIENFTCYSTQMNWVEYEKLLLILGGESRDKISVLTKEQKWIIEKLGFADALPNTYEV